MTHETRNPAERFARVAALLRAEREKLARLVDEAKEALASHADVLPSSLGLRGIGDIVHDFYTGTERIFENVAPDLNGGLPAGPSWHRRLLTEMTLDIAGVRPPLLRKETAVVLEDYLRFRHRFRNLYGFELEWPKVRELLQRLPAAWQGLSADLDRFLAFLDAAARA